MDSFNICIIKPNKSSYSETFIQTQIDLLKGKKHVLYGGDFPLYQPNGKFLIPSWLGIIYYLIQKRIFKKRNISTRNKALVEYLKKHQISVVLAEYGTVGATITKACSMAGIPLVIHFHGVDAHRYKLLASFKELYKQAFAYAAALVVVSGDMRNNLIALGAPEKKIKLIPYGVDTSLFKQISLSEQINFLFIGRLVDKKSPLTVIAAFANVVDKFPDAKLRMVGDGPLLPTAQLLTKDLGLEKNISFTGVLSRQEIMNIMADSYCYVQHSVTAVDGDMEGTPNTILEASAVGLPIVSTRHAGIKEAVIDGVTGFLVNEHDKDAMASSMIEIASSRVLATKMGNAARAHMLEHYNITEQIAKLDAVLQNAAKH